MAIATGDLDGTGTPTRTPGVLPIKIEALPEGSLAMPGTCLFKLTNTHPRYFWLPSKSGAPEKHLAGRLAMHGIQAHEACARRRIRSTACPRPAPFPHTTRRLSRDAPRASVVPHHRRYADTRVSQGATAKLSQGGGA